MRTLMGLCALLEAATWGCADGANYRCASAQDCPSGFYCDAEQLCRASAAPADASAAPADASAAPADASATDSCARQVCDDGYCPGPDECCAARDCGPGAWRCEARLCRCQGALVDDTCGDQQASSCALGLWRETTSLPRRMREQATVAYRGHIFLTGGFAADTTTLADVHSAPASSGGDLGAWTQQPALNTPRRAHSSVAYRDHLYVLGGHDGARIDSVEVAPVLADMSLGGWIQTTPLPRGIASADSAIAFGGSLYLFGGALSGDALSADILRAPVQPDGSLGAWSIIGALPEPGLFMCRLFADQLSCLRRWPLPLVPYSAPLQPGGQVGPWTQLGTRTLPQWNVTSAMSADGCVHTLGGYDADEASAAVRSVVLGADHVTSSLRADTSLPAARGYASAATVGQHLYLFGGNEDLSDPLTSSDRVWVAPRAALVLHDDFSQALPVTDLGHHVHRLASIEPITGDYRIEYDWMTAAFFPTNMGFNWDLIACQQARCDDMNVFDIGSRHFPDTDTGFAYGLGGIPDVSESYWGPAQVNTWYMIKVTRVGVQGTWELFDAEGERLAVHAVSNGGFDAVDQIAITAWDRTYMVEQIERDIEAQRLSVLIYRHLDGNGSDQSYIDDLYVYDL